ncbi:MAG: SDH family Clp fold serine proteinase, partial [Nitrososphaera sp.]
ILLHSPGGLAEAADSLVEIIRGRFQHVRFIVPNMAKSAATMLALSGDQILMDVASELGPIDPQFNFRKGDGSFVTAPAQAIIDQFEAAQKKIAKDPTILAPWLPILQQYGPSLYQQARNAIELSKNLVNKWLMKYMLKSTPKKEIRARGIANYLSNHNNFKSHAKRIGMNDMKEIKALKAIQVTDMREDPELQNRVWGLYHAISLTFGFTAAYKIFENTSGRALIRLVQQVQIVGPMR